MTQDHNRAPIRMLIVDDEPIICEGLRKTIDWSKHEIVVVGEAYDGEEALRMTKEHDAQIVLTDIRMDGMDGLELAKHLRKELPHVRVIMISGHEDFEYARQALRLGVNDYLLKPVQIDELIETVHKAAEEIRSESPRSSKRDEKVLWLSRVIHGLPGGSRQPPASMQGLSCFRMMASQLEQFMEHYAHWPEDEYRKLQERWKTMLRERLAYAGMRCVSVFIHKNLLYTLIMSEKSLPARQIEEIIRNFHSEWDGPSKPCFGVSRAFSSLSETGEAAIDASDLLQYHVIERKRLLIAEHEEGIQETSLIPDIDFKTHVLQTVSALFRQDADEVLQIVHQLFDLFKQERLVLRDAIKLYEEFIVLLRQRLRQSGLKEAALDRTISLDLNLCNSYSSIQKTAEEEMRELMRLIDLQGIDKSYWIIEKAKMYMDEQYYNDIKASEVARWLKITPSYFSNLFKQSTGKSFREYMNELRIEHAKQLLVETNDKVFEIAAKVGYKEYKYFVSVFKSYTGMTPKEYRALNVNRRADA